MATIFLARTSGTAGFEKLVVLKCILPVLARDDGFVAMFLDEARIAAKLRHANIADVIDVGHEGDTYFFAMEYVPGQNARAVRIEARQRGLPIPLEVSLAIVIGTASALGYASDGPLGIVHRDVSPTNVIVGYEGAIKLVDFGIARATMRRGKTRTGMRKGKAPYMSPEQCRGMALDRRSDLFSLGTMLYELTCGTRPFHGATDFEVMDAIVHGHILPPSTIVPGYPRGLEQIVMRLLADSPDDRYQSALPLLEDLDALVVASGMLASSQVVARYMNELFGESADTITEMPPARATREYPTGKPPASLLADEEPTVAFGQHLWTPELLSNVRRPKRQSTQPPPGDEATSLDPVPAFDPIDARGGEMLDELDAFAPPAESSEQRALRRITTLMQHAMASLVDGDPDRAVTAVELALEEDLHVPATQHALQSHVGTIVASYEALLEDPYRTLELARTLPELVPTRMEPRTRLLLPFIDGRATIAQIVERSGMQRLEAYHHLCQLLLRGVVR